MSSYQADWYRDEDGNFDDNAAEGRPGVTEGTEGDDDGEEAPPHDWADDEAEDDMTGTIYSILHMRCTCTYF